MKLSWALAFGLLLAPSALAQNKDERAVRTIVAGIYKGYGKADGTGRPPRLSAGLAAVERECTTLGKRMDQDEDDSSYGTCSNDYDLFCQCQDSFGIDFKAIKVAVRFPAAARAEADLDFKEDPGPELTLRFVRGRSGWELDDVWEFGQIEGGGEASYRTRLLRDIAEMRTTLKLPAWKVPARNR